MLIGWAPRGSPTASSAPHADEDVAAVSAAHDIKNLLFLIGARSERLRSAIAPDHPNRAEVDAIVDATRQGVALTLELLASRRGAVAPADLLDLNVVVRGLQGLLTSLADRDVAVVMRLDPSLASVRARFSHVEQVLMNLSMNARDAMPYGGTLTIATANRVTPGFGRAAHHQVVLTVSDTGTGIAPDALARIFDPLYTTKQSTGGTGLGLAVVRRLVSQMGGVVEIDTARGEGTSFRVVLPRADAYAPAEAAGAPAPPSPADVKSALADAEASAPRRAHGARPSQAPTRILIAEDDPDVLRMIRLALEESGQLEVASTGREALDRMTTWRGDLLVTDVNLGDISGIELADIMRMRNPSLSVVFITGEALRGVPSSLADAQVLEKPFSIVQLRLAIAAALRGRVTL